MLLLPIFNIWIIKEFPRNPKIDLYENPKHVKGKGVGRVFETIVYYLNRETGLIGLKQLETTVVVRNKVSEAIRSDHGPQRWST